MKTLLLSRNKRKYLLLGRFLTFITGTIPVILCGANTQAQTNNQCFPETGHCVDKNFIEFWQKNGGESIFGHPIGPIQEEFIEGEKVQVQWFQYNRLEVHPDKPQSQNVLVGKLGIERLEMLNRDWRSFPTSQPKEDCLFFESTGHNLCGFFLSYWQAHGLELDGVSEKTTQESLALFGAPISEARTEEINGKSYTVQWFEKARLQYLSDEQPSKIGIGQLGAELFPLMPPTFIASSPKSTPNRSLPTDSLSNGLPSTDPLPTDITPIDSSSTGLPSTGLPTTGLPSTDSPPVVSPNLSINILPNKKPADERLAALNIVNNTGGILRLNLDGRTQGSWTLADEQILKSDIQPGTYQSRGISHCGSYSESFTIEREKTKELNFICETAKLLLGKLRVFNNTEGLIRIFLSGPISDNWSVLSGISSERELTPGSYQISVSTLCGKSSQSFTINEGNEWEYTTECGRAIIRATNNTVIPIKVSLSGPTTMSQSIGDGNTHQQEVFSGDYKLTFFTACGSRTIPFSIAKGETRDFTTECPPNDPRTTRIRIINRADETIRVTLSGSTSISRSIGSGSVLEQPVFPGSYNITAQNSCGEKTENFTVSTGQSVDYTFICPIVTKPEEPQSKTTSTITIENRTGGSLRVRLSGSTSVNRSVGNERTLDLNVVPGNYRMNVTARCGSEVERFTIDDGDSQNFSYECLTF